MPKQSDIPAYRAAPSLRSCVDANSESRIEQLVTPRFGGGVEAGVPNESLPIREIVAPRPAPVLVASHVLQRARGPLRPPCRHLATFQPARERNFDELWNAAMKLGELGEEDLPGFPHLSTAGHSGPGPEVGA
jgi:hypothetical protein